MNKKYIEYDYLKQRIEQMIYDASYNLPSDIYQSIKESIDKEKSKIGKSILKKLLENADIARNEKLPICQDTGVATFFVELGDQVEIKNGHIQDAINEATSEAYTKGYLRPSMVKDPLFNRKNTGNNTPAIIHYEFHKGDTLKILFAPKGGGAENMSGLKMFKPLSDEKDIIDYVCEIVLKEGGNPCPPVVIGIGIGGNFEYACFLAKKALFRPIGLKNPNPDYDILEKKILNEVNSLGVGPQGLGGSITAIAVNILSYPCHIASLPVAVNLNCHASRHSFIEL